MPTLSELLANKLAEARVDVVFGLPGGENVDVLDALRKRGIEFVLVRNESSAVFMADVHARLTGGIGVALTTLGPGATNAYAGIAHAWLDRSPVLLITAQTDPKLVGDHTHQVLDLQAVFRPVTKFTVPLAPESATETISHALALLRSGRPGPVHVSIPAVFATREINLPSPSLTPMLQPTSPAADLQEKIEIAKNMLASSHRPVIVLGLGLEPDKPYPQLRTLAESLNAPVIDTPKSKGALPADHPLFVGTLGLTMTDPAYSILDASDCIIAVGFDVVELVKPWSQPQPLIWISNWENDDPRIDSACELVGSIKDILDALLDVTASVDDAWGEKRMSAWRETHLSKPNPATSLDDPSSSLRANSLRSGRNPVPNRILPADVMDSIRTNTPPEVIITTDVGSHKIFTCLHWKTLRPNSFFVSNGLSVMGFGLAAAIAAARQTRETTVCITGDAGLAMVMGELSLIVELDLPVIVIVMNDAALDLIRFAQRRKQVEVFGTEFANPDYEKIASAFGFAYSRIQNKAECDTGIKQAVVSRKPTLLEVMIDPAGYR